MRWYLNDVSIHGQYENRHDEFLKILSQLISIRNRNRNFRDNLHVISTFGNAKVDQELMVSHLLYGKKFPEYKSVKAVMIQLINKSEPFEMEGEKKIYENNGEKIEFDNTDVKHTAMGLAVYNIISGNDSSLFSFADGNLKFENLQLTVELSTTVSPVVTYYLENHWKPIEFEKHIRDIRPRKSWEDLIRILRDDFKNIEFSDDIFRIRKKYKYSEDMHKNIVELLGIINKYMCHCINGVEDNVAKEIRENIFLGTFDKISDETTGNIKEFRKEMTFKSINGGEILASWHGKFWAGDKRFSIHFDWPPDKNKKKIEILYIGEKITV